MCVHKLRVQCLPSSAITFVRILCIFLLSIVLSACNSNGTSLPPSPTIETATDLPSTEVLPEATQNIQSTQQPPDNPSPPTPTPTSEVMTPAETPAPLFYNLPPATLTSATGLYASPNRGDFIVPVTIPAGEIVYVMGRNGTGSHLRAVWNTGVGWIPVSFTDYNGRKDRLSPLPIFTREPPACAIPLTTQFGLNSTWVSAERQRIAVVADLFRSRYGAFPRSSLSLTVNGAEVESSRRQIVEQGQFSLKDVVFTLPQDVQSDDVVGYLLQTSSDEPLTFMATIFSIPPNCQWDTD